MLTEPIRIAVVATEGPDVLSQILRKMPAVSIVATTEGYRLDPHSPDFRALAEARPEIVMVGVSSSGSQLIQAIRTLRQVVPESMLFACLSKSDPQIIIEAMRAGAGEFLEAPVSEADVQQAIARYVSERHTPLQTEASGALYSIIAGKLSSGATTVAINTANTIATETDAPTLLIDLDMPLGDAAAYLNLRPQYTVQDALGAASRLDSTLLENFTVKAKNSNLNLLGGFRDYTARSAVTPSALESLLRVSRRTFSHTFLDISGSIDGDQAVVIARQSNQILIVLTPDLPAIWRTEKLITFLSHHGAADNVKLVLNRTSKRDDIGERDIERLLSQPVYHSIPNDYGACLKAINSGRPLQQEDSRSLHHSINQLALQMAGIRNRKDSKGFLGMFLRPSSIGG